MIITLSDHTCHIYHITMITCNTNKHTAHDITWHNHHTAIDTHNELYHTHSMCKTSCILIEKVSTHSLFSSFHHHPILSSSSSNHQHRRMIMTPTDNQNIDPTNIDNIKIPGVIRTLIYETHYWNPIPPKCIIPQIRQSTLSASTTYGIVSRQLAEILH